MKYRAFNNGLQVQHMEDSYVAQTGEVLFDHFPTAAELTAAFPQYASAINAVNLAWKASAALRDSNDVVLRHLEAGVALNGAWKAYRAKLRSLVNGGAGASDKGVPAQPPIPNGV